MRNLEELDETNVLAEAESIIRDNRSFTEDAVVEAAYDILENSEKDSTVVNVELDDELFEFVSTVYAEQAQLEQAGDNYQIGSKISITSPVYESAGATLSSKFDLLARIRNINPIKTPLTLREIHLINRQLTDVIARLKILNDTARLKIYKELYRSLNEAFLKATESDSIIRHDLIEGIIELEKSK